MNRDELLKAMQLTASPKPIKVEGTPWGTVYVKIRTVEEVDQEIEVDKKREDGKRLRLSRGAANVICNEQGELMFDAKNDEDLLLLSQQPWAALERVLSAANVNPAEGKIEPVKTS